MEKSLITGSTTMLIMKLLEAKDMYGYEMIESLRLKSNNVFELKAGTLYPILHSLEEKGFVVSYEEEVLGKKRKYYSLTNKGRRQYLRQVAEWKEYTDAVVQVLGGECYGNA